MANSGCMCGSWRLSVNLLPYRVVCQIYGRRELPTPVGDDREFDVRVTSKTAARTMGGGSARRISRHGRALMA